MNSSWDHMKNPHGRFQTYWTQIIASVLLRLVPSHISFSWLRLLSNECFKCHFQWAFWSPPLNDDNLQCHHHSLDDTCIASVCLFDLSIAISWAMEIAAHIPPLWCGSKFKYWVDSTRYTSYEEEEVTLVSLATSALRFPSVLSCQRMLKEHHHQWIAKL